MKSAHELHLLPLEPGLEPAKYKAYLVVQCGEIIFEHIGWDAEEIVVWKGDEYKLNHLLWGELDQMAGVQVYAIDFQPIQLFAYLPFKRLDLGK